jgi:hypothetical protein
MTTRRIAAGFLAIAALSLPGPAWAQHVVLMQQAAACDVTDMNSPPAVEWMRTYGWRYPSPALARAGYLLLVNGQSPWPDWFTPAVSVLPPGTLFQVAIDASQPDTNPGVFGTFDWIDSVGEVRDDLAVLQAWMPDVQRVTTFRVTQPLPVLVGPIGPQVDPATCRLLPGRFSQFEMLVPAANVMTYLAVVSSRPIE